MPSKYVDLDTARAQSKSIKKSYFNLGIADTKSGKIITRRTQYNDLGNLDWTYNSDYSVFVSSALSDTTTVSGGIENAACSKYDRQVGGWSALTDGHFVVGDNGWSSTPRIIIKDTSFNGDATAFKIAMQGVLFQHQCISSYTEDIVNDQPLNTLDKQGNQFLRKEWEKSLQLWDEQWEVGYINTSTGENQNANDALRSKNFIEVSNDNYFLNAPAYNNSSNRIRIYFYGANKTFISASLIEDLHTGNGYAVGTFNPNGAKYFRFASANLSTPVQYQNNIMVTKSNHAYPHQDYNQSAHITNEQAELLKSEEEFTHNLWDEEYIPNYYYSPTDGTLVQGETGLCSKNFIRVKPNTTYCILADWESGDKGYRFAYYSSDSISSYLSSYPITLSNSQKYTTFTTPANCYFLQVSFYYGYGNVYKNDVSIFEGTQPVYPYKGQIAHKQDVNNMAKTNVNNNFSSKQTISDTSDVPIVLKSNRNNANFIQFLNNANNGIGYIGINNSKPYFISTNSSIKPSGYLLTEDDIDSVPTDGSTKAVSSNGVYDSITTVTAIAEGKTKSYTIALSSNASFNTQADAVSSVSSITDISGNTINVSNMKNGDIILIIDLEVPDRWYSATDGKFYKMETSKVDLNNYLQRDGSNTITGNIMPDSSGVRDLGAYNNYFHYIATKRLITQTIHNGAVSGSNQITVPAQVVGNMCVNSIDNTFSAGQTITSSSTALTLNPSSNGGTPGLNLNDSGNVDWMRPLQILAPNLSTSKHAIIALGTSASQYNQGYLAFYNNGSGSSNNLFTLGMYSQDDVIAISAAGNVGIGLGSAVVPTGYKLKVNGSANVTSMTIDQKATMQYNSNEDCIDFIFN